MGRKLDAATLQSVLLDLAKDFPLKTTAKRNKVSRTTVKKIELSMDVYGSPYPPDSCVQGRPKLLLKVQEEVSPRSLRWQKQSLARQKESE
jgi:hypothetical protein